MQQYTYGLMIKTEFKYGSDWITVNGMKREEREGMLLPDMHPLNCNALEYETELLGRSDLELFGMVSEYDGRFDRPKAQYGSIYGIEERRAAAMAKMLHKVNQAIHKAEASEPGDVFTVFAKAIGAQWVCETRNPGEHYSSYRDVKWRWNTIAEGREAYRAVIRKAEADQLARGTTKNKQFA